MAKHIYDGPEVSLSLQHFLKFSSEFFYFPSPFLKFPFRVSFLLPSPFILFLFRLFFYFSPPFFILPFTFFLLPFRVCLLRFSIFQPVLLSVSIFTSLPSLFTSLQSIHNSFYLPSVFFTTLQRCVIFLLSFSICLLPFSFLKLFLLSFGIFIVSFLFLDV